MNVAVQRRRRVRIRRLLFEGIVATVSGGFLGAKKMSKNAWLYEME